MIIQLHFRGYNIGIRLIDEFLAKSNVSRCVDFKETAEVIAKVCHIIWFISKTSVLLFKCLKPGILILVVFRPKVKLLTFKTHFACKASLFLVCPSFDNLFWLFMLSECPCNKFHSSLSPVAW